MDQPRWTAHVPSRDADPYVALRPELPNVALTSADSALLVIDMQRGCVGPDWGFLRSAREAGREREASYFRRRIDLVAGNIARLLAAFRSSGIEVCHTKIASATLDGRDRSQLHKRLGIGEAPEAEGSLILEAVAPESDEIVFTKTASGVFNATNIDYVLRNLGVRKLAICGVVTTGCVETAVRDAADRGYEVVLIEDACAAVVEAMHYASIRAMRDVYAKIKVTDEVLAELRVQT